MAAGAVLCGGRSTRMGADKATMAVDGVPMARRVAGALEGAGCAPVVAIGGDSELPTIADDHPGQGPLGGIITALRAGLGDVVVVAACDLPWLDAATVADLLAHLAGHEVAVADTGELQPLCAAWRAGAIAALEREFAAGTRAVHLALDGLDVVRVAASPAALRNVNAPADVDEAR